MGRDSAHVVDLCRKSWPHLLGNNTGQCLRNRHLPSLLSAVEVQTCSHWLDQVMLGVLLKLVSAPLLSLKKCLFANVAVSEKNLFCWCAVSAAWAIMLKPSWSSTKTLLTALTLAFISQEKKTLRKDMGM